MPSHSWEELPARREREGKPPGMTVTEYAFALLLATFAGGKVNRNGGITAYFDWWRKASPRHRALADHYAACCALKVERDHRDPEECARAGAEALRRRLESEPRPTLSSVQIVPGMIGQIMDTAWEINRLCDEAKCDDAQRRRLHSMHGEMIARGCDSPGEILRTVAAVLGLKYEPQAAPGIGVAVATGATIPVQRRISDEAFFEGKET